MVKRWLTKVCLKVSAKLALLAFKLSDQPPIQTAVSTERKPPVGDITPNVSLSLKAIDMRADLHTPPTSAIAEKKKPLAGSIEERLPNKWE